MYYSEDLVEEVRAANDIVDVISGYVNLKKQGSSYFGLCPFHNEKSPSFSVTPSKQMFYCFGCGEGGNVFSFITKYENCSFVDAMNTLAARVGITLPEREMTGEEKRQQSVKQRILEINKLAAKYYYAMLRSETGAAGFQYLSRRELTNETMQQWGLGFAPANGGLYAYLKKAGYDDGIIRQSGLFGSDEKHGIYDKFWNRVIFPIMDVNSRVIAFGGRVMGDAKPKYLNSPETPVFDKSRNLFGLNRAKISRKKEIIVCEGYMDVISMHQAGFDQAVASLGTAFTPGHAALLKKYTKEVLLIYDSDEAGIKAALRAIPAIKGASLTPRVVNLKPYKDPDEFIKNLGMEEFQKRLDEAENSFYFELRMLERDYNMSDPDGRTRFQEETAKRIARMENELERENYISAVASKYSIAPKNLEAAVAREAARQAGIESMTLPRSGRSSVRAERESGISKAQRLLITCLADNPGIYEQIEKHLKPEDFEEGINRRVAMALYEQLKDGKLNPAAIVSLFEDEKEHNQVALLFNSKYGEMETKSEREKYITELVVKIKKNSLLSGGNNEENADPLKAALNSRKSMDELSKIHISL